MLLAREVDHRAKNALAVVQAIVRLARRDNIADYVAAVEGRVGALAHQEIIHGRRISPDEIIEWIEAVTPAETQRVAQECFSTNTLALGALGNLNGFSVDRARLEI